MSDRRVVGIINKQMQSLSAAVQQLAAGPPSYRSRWGIACIVLCRILGLAFFLDQHLFCLSDPGTQSPDGLLPEPSQLFPPRGLPPPSSLVFSPHDVEVVRVSFSTTSRRLIQALGVQTNCTANRSASRCHNNLEAKADPGIQVLARRRRSRYNSRNYPEPQSRLIHHR